jgi:2-methylisocitrate lyase-like PEP mutase family enzyme
MRMGFRPDMSKAEYFRGLHHGQEIFLMPNAWDAGSAKILAHLGFRCVATTSSGSAAARGRLDGSLDRDTVLAHVSELAAAVEVPVSADLEDCFAEEPAGVADTIRLASRTGISGASVEDWSGSGIYEPALAAERVAAAVAAAAGALVITARAENHVHGVDDRGDTIARLQSYQEAGADVLFAPGICTREQIAAVVGSVDAPVNVLVRPGMVSVAELAELGVRRVSVGGAFAFAAYGALLDAARELATGTYGFLDRSRPGSEAVRDAFGT